MTGDSVCIQCSWQCQPSLQGGTPVSCRHSAGGMSHQAQNGSTQHGWPQATCAASLEVESEADQRPNQPCCCCCRSAMWRRLAVASWTAHSGQLVRASCVWTAKAALCPSRLHAFAASAPGADQQDADIFISATRNTGSARPAGHASKISQDCSARFLALCQLATSSPPSSKSAMCCSITATPMLAGPSFSCARADAPQLCGGRSRSAQSRFRINDDSSVSRADQQQHVWRLFARTVNVPAPGSCCACTASCRVRTV